MSTPEALRFTLNHEWSRRAGTTVVVGITDYAQRHLGAVVHVELPPVGAVVRAGDPCAEIESTKSVSEIYAPVDGTVEAVNDAVADAPDLVNEDPYGRGWLFVIEAPGEAAGPSLLSSAEYDALMASLPGD